MDFWKYLRAPTFFKPLDLGTRRCGLWMSGKDTVPVSILWRVTERLAKPNMLRDPFISPVKRCNNLGFEVPMSLTLKKEVHIPMTSSLSGFLRGLRHASAVCLYDSPSSAASRQHGGEMFDGHSGQYWVLGWPSHLDPARMWFHLLSARAQKQLKE